MQLVDEENDFAVALLDHVEHILEALLKLTAEFCARDQRAHIQRKHLAVFQVVRHVSAHDAQRKPLRNRGFAHARLTDEHRVVLRLARKDANHAADLVVTPNHGVELLISRELHQILSIFREHVICALRIVGGHRLVAANDLELVDKRFFGDVVAHIELLERIVCFFEQA